MKRLVSILSLALLLLGVVTAQADGYTYDGQYWWLNGNAYQRTSYQEAGRWYCGCYYPGRYVYAYHQVAKPSYATQTAVNATTYDAAVKRLLDMAKERQAVEGRIRASAHEHNQIIQLASFLGLQGNFRWEGFGVVPPYNYSYSVTGAESHAYSSVPTIPGNTIYGTTYNQTTQLYGDPAVQWQQAARLTENAQQLSGRAYDGFQALMTLDGQNRARVAEIMAKGDAAVRLAKTLEGAAARIETKGYSFQVVPGQGPQARPRVERNDTKVPQEVQQAMFKGWEASSQARCASCHGPEGAWKAKFDLSTYPKMEFGDKVKVVQTMLMPEDATFTDKEGNVHYLFMPRDTADIKKAGQRVPLQEVEYWLAR